MLIRVVMVLLLLCTLSPLVHATIIPACDDTYISGYRVIGTFGLEPTLWACNYGDGDVLNSRKVYVQFDASLHPQASHSVTLSLVQSDFEGSSNPALSWRYVVYGLTVSTPWSERTLSWNNAPANITDSGAGIRTGLVYGGAPIADFSIKGKGAVGLKIDMQGGDGSPLLAFVNSHVGEKLTFIILRESEWSLSNQINHVFASRQYQSDDVPAGAWAPTLTLTPEPGSMVLLAAGSVALLLRRRR